MYSIKQYDIAGAVSLDATSQISRDSIAVGGQAHQGEAMVTGFEFNDDAAAELPTHYHRLWKMVESATASPTTLWQGRHVVSEVGRGTRVYGDARAPDISFADINSDLHGIVLAREPGIAYKRPSETDVARVKAVAAYALNGDPRVTTDLDRTTWVPNTNTETMDARTYDFSADPWDVIDDCAREAGKTFFVTVDGEIWYDLGDSTAYAADLEITDVNPDSVDSFAPIFQGKSSTWDGTEHLTGAAITYNNNKFAITHRAARYGPNDWWEKVIADVGAITEASARHRASALLNEQDNGRPTIRCSIKLKEDQVDKIKWGQTLNFRAAAAGITSTVVLRVASLVWEPYQPHRYLAHLELGFPRKLAPDLADHGPGTIDTGGHTTPFVQTCSAEFVQGAVSTDAGGSYLVFGNDMVDGHLCVYFSFADPGSATTTDNGWTPVTPVITIPFSIHLGGPAHARAWVKVITHADHEDPVSHVFDQKRMYGAPTLPQWTVASGFQSAGMEVIGDIASLLAVSATGASTTADPGGAAAGKLGLGFATGVGFPNVAANTVGGYSNGGSTDKAWSGYVNGTPTDFGVALGVATEWVAISVGVDGECSEPEYGAWVTREQIGTGDGSTVDFFATWKFINGSETVDVDGIVVADTPDGANKKVTLPAAPSVGAKVYAKYQADHQ